MTDDLKKGLTQLALSIRKSTLTDVDPRQPRLVENDVFFQDGRRFRRKRIILRSMGCSIPTCTMCPFTNETLYRHTDALTARDYINQFLNAFVHDALDDYDMVCVYNDGNFFSDQELPAEARRFLYNAVAASRCDMLTVESLPQFITLGILDEAASLLAPKKLSVGIGLQSAAPVVRELCVNTSFTNQQFEAVVARLQVRGCVTKVYVMVKPPFLTEAEGVADAVASVRYARSLGITSITLCPTRVSPNTVVEKLYNTGAYTPPWLWSIVEILRQTHCEADARVACINLRGTDFQSIHPSNCEQCSDEVVNAIEQFNVDRDIEAITAFRCACQDDYRAVIEADRDTDGDLRTRVREFLSEVGRCNHGH